MANSSRNEVYFTSERDRKIYVTKKVLHYILVYAFLTILGLFMIIPFYYMIINSFKDAKIYENELLNSNLNLFDFSSMGLSLNNFKAIFNLKMGGKPVNIGMFFLNTFIVSILSTIFTLITTVLASFAFARINFKGKNILFSILLATMMIPGEMMIITNYQTTLTWNMANTYSSLIFVQGVSVFYIFYLRQTFQQIPNELYLASKVDGYGTFSYLWKVMIPIAMPTIISIAILSLMGAWNSYVWPNLIASGENPIFGNSMKLVSNGLMDMFTNSLTGESNDTAKMAAALLVTIPLFIFFLIFRKKIMSGVSRSGIKG
ncbi:MAG TPA: carbohydrate ABC transporter permease [Clostridiales bacterium]|nr:carbohydrate ABC transporter permease [Clostridiales bacterium]